MKTAWHSWPAARRLPVFCFSFCRSSQCTMTCFRLPSFVTSVIFLSTQVIFTSVSVTLVMVCFRAFVLLFFLCACFAGFRDSERALLELCSLWAALVGLTSICLAPLWRCTRTRQSVLCPSTFDPQSLVCLTSLSALYISPAPARWEEVYSSTLLLLLQEHKHGHDLLPRRPSAIGHVNSQQQVSSRRVDKVTFMFSALFSIVPQTHENYTLRWHKAMRLGLGQCECQLARGFGRRCIHASARYRTTGLVCVRPEAAVSWQICKR